MREDEVTMPRLRAQKRLDDIVVGQNAESILLRGDYSPRTVLTGEVAPKKNETHRITLEISEKFITAWTRYSNGKKPDVVGTHVHIFRRGDKSIWYGFGTPDKVRVDGRTYTTLDPQYEGIVESMAATLGDLFFAHPGDASVLTVIDEITGKQADSLNRFLKLLMKFVD